MPTLNSFKPTFGIADAYVKFHHMPTSNSKCLQRIPPFKACYRAFVHPSGCFIAQYHEDIIAQIELGCKGEFRGGLDKVEEVGPF